MMRRSPLMCAIGATLLGSVALIAQSQTQTPATPAAATAPSAPANVPSIAKSLGLVVYPAKGQTPGQQSVDEQECYTWSKSQTGIDPQAPAPVATTPAESRPAGGQRVRSAARGAAAGAVVGEVANNDADEGAKVGAAVGVVAGGRQKREDKRAHEQQSQDQAQAAQIEQRETFKKALGTCMQGRGYTTG